MTKIIRVRKNDNYLNVIVNDGRYYIKVNDKLIPIFFNFDIINNHTFYMYSNKANDKHEIGYKSKSMTKDIFLRTIDKPEVHAVWNMLKEGCKVKGTTSKKYFYPTQIKYV